MSLPLGYPATTSWPSASTPASLRSRSEGAARWNTQRRLPSSADNPKMRPSEVRTTTTLRDTAAGAITSPATREVHISLPELSRAITSPFMVPAMILPSPTSRPPESRFLVSTFVMRRPVSSSMMVTVPSPEAAYTRPS